jgi:hypothetical protein
VIRLCLALLLLGGAAAAQAEWQPRRIAELQALDKVTARTARLEAGLDQPVRYGTLTITVRACRARPADEVPDAAAFLEIRDSRAEASAPPAFRGWMFANNPSVSMLEHAVYDVRVLGCRQ